MRFIRFPTLVLACSAVACADITPPLRYNDVDYLLAELSAPAGTPTGATLGGPTPITAFYGSTCPFSAATSMFVCDTRNERGVNFSLSFQLLDASGAPMTTQDAALTDAIRAIRTNNGAVLALNGDTIARNVRLRSDRTLSGLIADARVVNGRDTMTITTIDTLGVQTHYTDVVTFNNFVPRVRNLPSSFPESGTITSQRWHSLLPLAGSPYITIVMTFNGSAVVQWAATSGGVTTQCTYTFGTTGLPVCP